jgi:hypothetical protein
MREKGGENGLFENSSLQDCSKFAIPNRRKSHKAIAMWGLWLLDF